VDKTLKVDNMQFGFLNALIWMVMKTIKNEQEGTQYINKGYHHHSHTSIFQSILSLSIKNQIADIVIWYFPMVMRTFRHSA
jgi:hypothetical protein